MQPKAGGKVINIVPCTKSFLPAFRFPIGQQGRSQNVSAIYQIELAPPASLSTTSRPVRLKHHQHKTFERFP